MECEIFTIISIDSLLVYKNKYNLKVYLGNCAYKIINKQMTDYFDVNYLKIRYFKCCIKIINSKGCMTCHFWFLNHRFGFQYFLCNGSHDLSMFSLTISDIGIITIKNADYHGIIHNIRKSKAINLLENSVFQY